MYAAAPRVVIGGLWEGGSSGILTASIVLREAFQSMGVEVFHFGYSRDWKIGMPLATESDAGLQLHTQPIVCHSEGILHRRAVGRWLSRVQPWAVWLLASRNASALPSGVSYVLWEATTWKDEVRAVRAGMRLQGERAGRGHVLHNILRPLDRFSERRAFGRASIVALMSAHTARQVIDERLAIEEKVCVLPPPPTQRFEEAAASMAAEAQPNREFIAVGRWVDPRKGGVLLEQAARRLFDRGERHSWTVIGGGGEGLAARLRGAGVDVEVVQAPDEASLVSEIRRHRYLVIPAIQEGFGIPGIEAFHCGVPVVSTRCGGPEDYVRDGETGFMCAADGSSLADTLCRAARVREPDRLEMARAARGDALTRFSSRQFRARLASLTERVFGAPQGVTLRAVPMASAAESPCTW